MGERATLCLLDNTLKNNALQSPALSWRVLSLWVCPCLEHLNFEIATFFPLSFWLLTFPSLCPRRTFFLLEFSLCLLFTLCTVWTGWEMLVSRPCFKGLLKSFRPCLPVPSTLIFQSHHDPNPKTFFSEYSWFLPVLQPTLIMLTSVSKSSKRTLSAQFSVSTRPYDAGKCYGHCHGENQEYPGLSASQYRPCTFNIPCSCSIHLFVHLLKWEKNSCTDLKQTKKGKKYKKKSLLSSWTKMCS